MTPEPFESAHRKARRMADARRRGDRGWSSLAHVGTLGWVFVLPVVLGAMAGGLLARMTGHRAWVLIPMLLGVAVGSYLVWWQLRRTAAEPGDADANPQPPAEAP